MWLLQLNGKRFGRLKVISDATADRKWLCECDCGKRAYVFGPSLTSGNTTSCGCRGRSVLGDNSRTHGLRRSVEYKAWASMKQRCTNPRDVNYPKWGGRGIAVCDRWLHDFAAFYADMGRKPTSLHTLERVNNDGPYAPENCVWATRLTQSRNNRHNRPLTFQGRTQLLTDWARELGISMPTLSQRFRRGWTVERALSIRVERHQ